MINSTLNQQFRQQFPFFSNEQSWTYLDSAATTLKPEILLKATDEFYRSAGSVHRSQYDLAQTEAYEQARDLVKQRFNIEDRKAVIWTSGTTHSINIVAHGIENQIQADDEIVVSIAEHHANFIPWQQLAERTGAKLIVLPVNCKFLLESDRLQQALSPRTKLVAFNLVSNVTGVHQNAQQLISTIRQHSSAKIMLDVAQAVCCEKVDIQALDADFYAFSAHKMYGPTGIGVLTGKLTSLEQLSPLFFGGKMLQNVTESQLTLAELPYRLEAGTPNIAGIIGFSKVLEWLNQWDFVELNKHLYQLAECVKTRLRTYPEIELISNDEISPTISFLFKNQHHADIAAILAEKNIALRVGEHCAKPYLRHLEKTGTLRISLAHYNNQQDIEQFFEGLNFALEILAD
ncbi:cysteine desulfurase [Pasteurellaceae bacterium LFhippo2]|nr:cysteine desulfurase [Pasteurellaceae bacterium LFhippo2]